MLNFDGGHKKAKMKWRKSHREAAAYTQAKQRCTNPKENMYYRYGGRGIKFLLTSYKDIIADIGKRPSKRYSLDRIDNDGDYKKGNLKWSTRKEQMLNAYISNQTGFCRGPKCSI